MPDFDPIAEAARNWDAHWGADPVPSMRAVTSIMRVQQILLARLNDELKRFDLTFPRYEALMLLYYSRRGSLPLGKMGDRLQVHRTSVTNIESTNNAVATSTSTGPRPSAMATAAIRRVASHESTTDRRCARSSSAL